MNTNIYGDFEICISVLLNICTVNQLENSTTITQWSYETLTDCVNISKNQKQHRFHFNKFLY